MIVLGIDDTYVEKRDIASGDFLLDWAISRSLLSNLLLSVMCVISNWLIFTNRAIGMFFVWFVLDSSSLFIVY